MKSLRILMLIERYWPLVGGSEAQCQLLAEALTRQGLQVVILTRHIQPRSPAKEMHNSVQINRIPPGGIGRIWKEGLFALGAAWWLVQHRVEYDLVHAHSATSLTGLVTLPVLGWLRKPRVVKIATSGDVQKSVIETTAGISRPSIIHRWINRTINRALRSVEALLAISHEIETELRSNGVAQEKIHFLPNAVDTKHFRPVTPAEREQHRAALSLPSGLLVLYSGRLIHRKGIDVLLTAWPEIVRVLPTARLILLGSGQTSLDSNESALREHIRQSGQPSSILLVGERSSVWEYLASTDVFVFPSRREGLSNALLEAMSTGCAVAATAIGGTVDVVIDGRNGLLCPPNDPTALAANLRQILQTPDLRQRLGSAARQTMLDHYAVERLLPHYVNLYQHLVYG